MKQASPTLNRVTDNLYRTGEGTYFVALSSRGSITRKVWVRMIVRQQIEN